MFKYGSGKTELDPYPRKIEKRKFKQSQISPQNLRILGPKVIGSDRRIRPVTTLFRFKPVEDPNLR